MKATNLLGGLSTAAIVGIVVAVVVVLLIIIIAVAYINMKNGLIRVVNQTEESWAGIDVYLKKRYDLVPNLVETVKGYAKHESETLDKVISARNVAMTASGNAKIDAEKAFGSELRTMMNLVIEKYPDLKADKQFLQLSGTLQNIETELVQARKYYNGNCRNYNNKIQLFPTSIVARRMGLEKRQYFELDSEEERRAPSVKF